MPSSLQNTLCRMPDLQQGVKKKKQNPSGWTEKPFFPRDTHFRQSKTRALCARRPSAPPAAPPTATAPPRSPRPPTSPKKNGLLRALSQGAPGLLVGAHPGEVEVSPGSMLCREGLAATRSGPRGLRGLCPGRHSGLSSD